MKLYWAPHTRSFVALWMLEETGAPYEREMVDIRSGAQSTPEYKAINPMAKVPTLVDDGTAISETAAICAYLADRVPEAKLAPPIGDLARGPYFKWLFFAPGCIEPAYMEKATNWQVESVAAGWGGYDRVIDVLDRALEKGPWILGDRFTAADVVIGSQLFYGVRMFGLVESRPSFEAYIQRFEARPAFQRCLVIDAEGAKSVSPPPAAA